MHHVLKHVLLRKSGITWLIIVGVVLSLLVATGRMVFADTEPADTVSIADEPLGTMANRDAPNVMLLLDTSDSMKWTHMPDDWEHDTTTYFPVGYKSALCNTLYYNPQTTYVVPKKADGTDMDTPVFTAAWKDGYDKAKGVTDLSSNFQAYDGDTRRRALYEDLPQPAYYFAWDLQYPVERPTVPNWERETTCTWPNVPYLAADDGKFMNSDAVWQNIPSVPGGLIHGVWRRTHISGDAQQRNFAIWYSYYRTRINMAKSSISLAFATLDNTFRVGFMSVAKPGAEPYSKFLPLEDFDGASKTRWFEAIQGMQTGGTSPAREALARAGRYYAGKSDGINDSMRPFSDPVKSACQRHYAIVTTDGYWSVGQETAGPVQIDGRTLVGQQDGAPLSLTDGEGLRPRPVFDGSVQGEKLIHDSVTSYQLADCELGWNVTIPGGGSKTETSYKKVVKKDVKTTTYHTADLEWARKRTQTMLKVFGKPSDLDWTLPKRQSTYWWAQLTSKVGMTRQNQRITWDYIEKSSYRYQKSVTWATETQTPWGEALAKQIKRKRYFYWYRNPTVTDDELKTTDINICKQFASGCTLEGNDQWEIVRACTPGMDKDYKVECETAQIKVSGTDYCEYNGSFIPGLGTIQCAGTWVPPYSGPVEQCGVIHPDLKAAILKESQGHGGNPLANVQFSNCDRTHQQISYVSPEQCKYEAPTQANGYKTTQCRELPYTHPVTDNSCAVSSTPQADATQADVYTRCILKSDSETVDSCTAGPIADKYGRINSTCVADKESVYLGLYSPEYCASYKPLGYTILCERLPDQWSGPVQQGSSECRNDNGFYAYQACRERMGGWMPVASCTEALPSAQNGWVGIKCANRGDVLDPPYCQPANGVGNIPLPPTEAVNPAASCTVQEAEPGNGCIYSACELTHSLPVDVALSACTDSAPTQANGWVRTTCERLRTPSAIVAACDGQLIDGIKTPANCRAHVESTDMAYGTCEQSVGADKEPSAANGWTTTSCKKVDAGSNGGMSTLESETEFQACERQAGTDSNGVVTSCSKDGPITINVPDGQGCRPGFDPATGKVTDCSGVGQGSTSLQASCPPGVAENTPGRCERATGRKWTYSTIYWTDKILLTGIAEGALIRQSTGQFGGDLENPAVCHTPEQWAKFPQRPAESTPVDGPAWQRLPATHKACNGKLPCIDIQMGAASNGSSNSLADVAQYYYATDLRPTMDNKVRPAGTGPEDDKAPWQHMSTYVIGMGVSGTLKYDKNYKNGTGDFADLRTGKKTWPVWPPEGGTTNYEQRMAIDDFWHTAVNGRGLYFSASDPKAIEAGLSEVFTDIKAAVGSGAGVAVSSAVVEADNNFAYGATYRTGRWSGDLLAYEIDLQSGLRRPIDGWSARTQLDARTYSDRKIYFRNGSALESFQWNKLGDRQRYFNNDAVKGLLAQYSQMSDGQKKIALGENLVDFLRGDRSRESFVSGQESRLYRTRESRLGDIIGSQPVYVGKPQRKYKDDGYNAFRLAQRNRTPMVYVGANDGMLHAFYAETNLSKTITGTSQRLAAREAWAFVPETIMPGLARLASTDYEGNHRYFVDGSPVVADIRADGVWKTILVGGFNKGGKGYYALDITDPENPKALWEVNRQNISTMGHSMGRPLISKLPDGTWVVFLTSGYNNDGGKGHVYVLNAATGRLLHTITTTGSGLKEINNYVRNPGADNTTTSLYGGDLLGNLWRFGFKLDGTPEEAVKLVTLTDDTGKAQAITTRVELVASPGSQSRPRILVGTGRLLGVPDLDDKNVQSVYGFEDGVYTSGVSLRSQLKQMKLEASTNAAGQQTRRLVCQSSAADCKDDAKGWYVDLPDSGERVDIDMRLAYSTLVFASNVPSPDACSTGGYGWINYLDFNTGFAVDPGADGAGDASILVAGSTISGHDATSNAGGKVTDHISTTGVPEKPIDSNIPYSTPRPTGKRISWREIVKSKVDSSGVLLPTDAD